MKSSAVSQFEADLKEGSGFEQKSFRRGLSQDALKISPALEIFPVDSQPYNGFGGL